MAVYCESRDANKNVNNAQRSIRAAALPKAAIFFDLCVSFWSLPSHVNDQTGTDGSQWIVEGVNEGKYHIADRWSPDKGPVRELSVNLAVGLAQMNVPKDELY
jgi:hypothetical protein